MTDAIESVGVYTPRCRIETAAIEEGIGTVDAPGVTRKSVPAADEDSITMATAAAREALDESEYDPEEFVGFGFGTSRPPVLEEDVGARLVEILGLPRDVRVDVHTQSTRAGVAALCAEASTSGRPVLTVAADCPLGAPDDRREHAAGAGAVAVVLAEDGPAHVAEVAHHSSEYPGTRFRPDGERFTTGYDATAYERDAFATVTAGAVSQLTDVPSALAPTATDGRRPYRATGQLDADPTVYELASELGDTGAASPLFGLLAAWDEGEDNVCVVGYGDGASADAVVIRGNHQVDRHRNTETVSYDDYLRKRGHVVTGSEGDL